MQHAQHFNTSTSSAMHQDTSSRTVKWQRQICVSPCLLHPQARKAAEAALAYCAAHASCRCHPESPVPTLAVITKRSSSLTDLGRGTLVPAMVACRRACSVEVPSCTSWDPALPRCCSRGLSACAAATAQGCHGEKSRLGGARQAREFL